MQRRIANQSPSLSRARLRDTWMPVGLAMLTLALSSTPVFAGLIPTTQQHPETPAVFAVTFGPGEAVWEKFGHNMLWIHNPQAPSGFVDVAYNWGMFDFDTG